MQLNRNPQKKLAIAIVARCFLYLIISTYFLSAWGCVSKNIIAEKPVEIPLTPEAIIEKITRTDQRKDTLKAIANIEINTAKIKYPVKAAVMIKRPSFLRFEVLPIIGPPSFFLSVNGETLKVFIPDKKKFYITKTKADYLLPFVPFQLQPETLLSLLMGSYPKVQGNDFTLKELSGDAFIRIDMVSGAYKIQSVFIEPQTYHIMRVDAYNDEGGLLYSARFEDYIEINNIPVPQRVKLSLDEINKSSITIRYSGIQLSTEKDTAQFDIPVPPGIVPNYLN
jgi:outer membrane lipoprotein-sorting protein